jgi:hypothetical protein
MGYFGACHRHLRVGWDRLLATMDSRAERRITEKSLEIAEATLRAQQQPELIAFQSPEGGPEREVHLAAYGALLKPEGQVWVRVDLMNANVAVVSFDVRNVGAGGAEVTRVRLMSLGAQADGREPEYWEPNASEQRLAVVAAGGTAPVDLVMAPVPPRWFYSHLKYGTKLWLRSPTEVWKQWTTMCVGSSLSSATTHPIPGSSIRSYVQNPSPSHTVLPRTRSSGLYSSQSSWPRGCSKESVAASRCRRRKP